MPLKSGTLFSALILVACLGVNFTQYPQIHEMCREMVKPLEYVETSPEEQVKKIETQFRLPETPLEAPPETASAPKSTPIRKSNVNRPIPLSSPESEALEKKEDKKNEEEKTDKKEKKEENQEPTVVIPSPKPSELPKSTESEKLAESLKSISEPEKKIEKIEKKEPNPIKTESFELPSVFPDDLSKAKANENRGKNREHSPRLVESPDVTVKNLPKIQKENTAAFLPIVQAQPQISSGDFSEVPLASPAPSAPALSAYANSFEESPPKKERPVRKPKPRMSIDAALERPIMYESTPKTP